MTKKSSLIALLLLVPAPSIGVLAGMNIEPALLGRILFFICKAWLLLFPLAWHLLVDKKKLSFSKPENGGFALSTLLGVVMSGAVFAAYFLIGKHLIDPEFVKAKMVEIRLNEFNFYIIGAAYWVLVNSVLEEYVWRWFVVKKCQDLMTTNAAIIVSALCFTIHHIFAMTEYCGWLVVSVASIGIFIGGAVWSWCYSRYKSVWPGYISHAIVDIAVFTIGYLIIFG